MKVPIPTTCAQPAQHEETPSSATGGSIPAASYSLGLLQRLRLLPLTTTHVPTSIETVRASPTSGLGVGGGGDQPNSTPTTPIQPLIDMFRQPPTEEQQRDIIRHGFMSLSSSF